ncbi:MAG: hypothetical protein R3C11_25915 [Planctomycetaceae bacterium]
MDERVPSHFGGTRNGLVVSWPAKVKAASEIRSQFHHVIDIAPTIYEAVGIPEPKMVNGIEQTPIAGISMGYTISDAKAEGRRQTQYFETGGHRAIYHNGWVATAFQGVPWELTGSRGFDNTRWELYNINEDFSEAVDLSVEYPGKLKELQAIFDEEATKYGVYPLDDRFSERVVNPERPSVTRGRKSFTYAPGTTRIPEGSAPPIYQRSHTISAKLDLGDEAANGVIVAEGGSSGGYVLYVHDGKLIYEYNYFGKERNKITSTEMLPSGEVEVSMDYEQSAPSGEDLAIGGKVTLTVNGSQVGMGKLPHVIPKRFPLRKPSILVRTWVPRSLSLISRPMRSAVRLNKW